ncbi:MAG: M6 family metalloprotease domain-containing protein [Prevotella sp.]|nr:M6 family metalloprotease domain-containing protein [Prevotella sp.]
MNIVIMTSKTKQSVKQSCVVPLRGEFRGALQFRGASLLIALAFTLSTFAVPAKRGNWHILTLADSTTVSAELLGNEFLRFWRSADGRTFVKDSDTGFFETADLQSLRERSAAKRPRARRARTSSTRNSSFIGEKKGLIILVEFSDLQFRSTHTPELYYQIANTEGFSNSMGFRGSVRDYFNAQSYGQFLIDFNIAGPVTLSKGYAYYGANDRDGMEYSDRLVELVEDACNAVDDAIDFSDYDWDGDGEVDQVFLLYAGRGEASGGSEDTIWPHEWDLYSAGGRVLPLDGVYVNTYACSCELASATQIDGIGSICHEFSHCLGIPDMYDTNSVYYGMDCWDLMDYGNYNGDSFIPAGYTSYERMFCGWSTPITLDENCSIEGMVAIGDGGDSYIIYNDNHTDEYYLLENRQLSGWDAGLPNSGLLILHVDYDATAWENNEVNTSSTQRCTIFPADNDFNLYHTYGDIYPYGDNNSLTSLSQPAALLNNPNANGTYYMNKDIKDITQNSDGTISFSFTNRSQSQDGINIVTSDDLDIPTSNAIYSITGSRLGTDSSILPHGIYIIGNKKILK